MKNSNPTTKKTEVKYQAMHKGVDQGVQFMNPTHEFIKSKDFPRACRVCEYTKESMIHSNLTPTKRGCNQCAPMTTKDLIMSSFKTWIRYFRIGERG